MTELSKFQAVNQCETGAELASLIGQFADAEGKIHGRTRTFSAEKMAGHVYNVIKGDAPANVLTREFGIRQQAIYIKYCEDCNI